MLKIFACGDIIINQDESYIVDKKLEEIISTADMAICNFEAPEKSDGKPINKAGRNISQSQESIKKLAELGFTHLSMANNHIYDFGEKGLHVTISKAKKHGLHPLGVGTNWNDAYKVITKIKNVKVGILALADSEFGCMYQKNVKGGYAYINHPDINTIIHESKKNADFIIISVHAGVECVQLPLPEWRNRYRELIDNGADLIIGHHPHTPQGYEMYDSKYIFYSLGNFHFNDYYKSSPEKDYSYSLLLDIKKNNKRQVFCDNVEIIYHKNINGITTSCSKEDIPVTVDELKNMLLIGYEQRVDKIIENVYKKQLIPFYQKAVTGLSRDMSFFQLIKRILASIVFPKRNKIFKNTLLLHNIRIDSHRFVIQRYLQREWEKHLQ